MYRTEYPRPDFERKDWLCLNGTWDFRFGQEAWQTIEVPFAYQTNLSGIHDNRLCDHITYRRTFTVPQGWEGKRIRMNFGAVDYEATVYINGQMVGSHIGGSLGFSFDITDELKGGEEEVVVEVYDPCLDETIPRGKQFWVEHSAGIWYTRTSGIWQSVWIEPVSALSFEYIRFTPDIDRGMVEIEYQLTGEPEGASADFAITFCPSDEVNTAELDPDSFPSIHVTAYPQLRHDKLSVDIFGQKIFRSYVHGKGVCWTPESPSLFEVNAVLLGEDALLDEVNTYFGMRKIHTADGVVFLNNRPYYQRLVLDQGYWPESLLTPPSDDAIQQDILLAKEMGFNGCRKHQKTEDPRFLYWADHIGYLVWEEIASAIQFSADGVKRLENEWMEAFARDYNHPSVVAWVVINESWAVPGIGYDKMQQSLALALYYTMHALDSTRLVISNDGWEMTKSDICAVHNYDHGNDNEKRKQEFFSRLMNDYDTFINSFTAGRYLYGEGYEYNGEPILITECGGIAFDLDSPGGWGYTTVNNEEDYVNQYDRVMSTIIRSDFIFGFCYTQLTDVEQEINGILTYDRKPKCDLAKIKAVNEQWRHGNVLY